jgi:hypothetical protein
MVNTSIGKVATWRTVYSEAVLTKHALNFIACFWRLIRDRLPDFVSRVCGAVKSSFLRLVTLTLESRSFGV